MLKKIFKILKKIITSFLILYGYNMIASPLGCIIPLNVITILSVAVLGIPALFTLIFLLVVVFWLEV